MTRADALRLALVVLSAAGAATLGVEARATHEASTQVAEKSAASAPAVTEFWKHWSDGKAEMNGYSLTQPRYGTPRTGSAALIYVTEDFSESIRVKADPGKHPPADVFPVLKLNTERNFQTGIYHYDVMTSVFARVSPGWPLAKVSFSSQEWCGHVYHQLLPRGGRLLGTSHSYFDGEADGQQDLEMPQGGVLEDALPILLRGWVAPFLERGQERIVPFLGSLLRARLDHRTLAWGRARIARGAAPTVVTVPFGRFSSDTWTVAVENGPTFTYQFEAEAPLRLLRWSADTGELAELRGSTRLAYWQLNGPGGEKHLKDMGLPGPPVLN